MRRRPSRELLDDDLGSPEEVAASLEDLWFLNRRFGVLRNYESLLRQAIAGMPAGSGAISWLEAGAGSGRTADWISRSLQNSGLAVRPYLMDRKWTHFESAFRRRIGPAAFTELRPVAADITQAPFAPQSFDLVSCSLLLHHFSGEAALELLRSLADLARHALVVLDLERAWPPYVFMHLLRPWFRSRLTRNDAPASFRQAYSRDEMHEMALAAGFNEANLKVTQLRPANLGLIYMKHGLRSGISIA